MTADVISLRPPGPADVGYWTCNCGCTTHRVRSDDEIECGSCGELANGIGYWRKPLPDEAPREAMDADAEVFTTADSDPQFARRRHAQRVTNGEFIIAIGIAPDGGLATCRQSGAVVSDEQRAWLRRRLDHAYDIIVANDKD